ncbi:MAG: hypothetical protein ACRYHQ_10145 [Janthinobacterium lividum]
MSETYTVSGRLMMTSNVPEVLTQMVRGFGEADKLINGMRETVGRLTTDFRELSEAGRGGRGGLSGLLKQLEKLGTAKIGGTIISDMGRMRETLQGAATAQTEMAKGAVETARAWREIAAAGAGRGGGGRGRSGGVYGPESPNGWNPAAREAYPDAQWGNANENAKSATRSQLYANDRALAEHEQTNRAAQAAAAARKYADDHALAMRENNDILARERAANRSNRQMHGHGMDAAMGAQMGGDAGVGLLERGFHAYGEVQTQQILTQADLRITDAVLAAANAKIAGLQQKYPALTQAEGLTLFRNGMGLIGDKDEALDMLPSAVRLQQLYQLAPAGRGGSGGSEVQAAEKAGDIMQQFVDPTTHKLDSKLYDQWMDMQARSYLAGGGLVDAKNWLAFARTSRTAGIGLSPKALEEAQALLEISPGRTGTALNSAFQVFGASTHHMTKATSASWHKAGLIDPKSGDIIDQKLYATDPFEWMWKDLVPKLAAQGIKTRDQILKWLTDNGQRGTVSGLLADVAIGETPIKNTMTRLESQDPKAIDKLVTSDLGKLAALQAAETNFYVALGKFGEGPGLMVISKLTTGLNDLTKFANDNPKLATNLITIGGGAAIFAKAAGDIGMAVYLGAPLVKGMGALATSVLPFGKGGVAAEAIAVASGGLSVPGSLAALAAAVVLLPPALKLTMEGLNGALGITPSQSGSAAKGAGHGPWAPGAPAAPHQSWGDWLHDQMATPTHQQSKGGLAHHAAYLEPAGGGRILRIENVMVLDGRVVHRSVMEREERKQSRDPSGITGFDGRQTMLPPSITTTSA